MSIDGFFDAGMLRQALEARTENLADSLHSAAEKSPNSRRREVGKRLRLSEY
jgi:carnitine O-acetyltransferase